MLTPDPVLFTLPLLGLEVTVWTLVALALGQLLFTLRVLVQWVLSEKRRESVTPRSFWWLSLVATVVFVAYSFQRSEIPYILGYAVNLVPYIRNLMLSYRPTRGAGPLGLGVCVLVVAAGVWMLIAKEQPAIKDAWVFFGLAGSLVFNSRFLVQWLQSERRGKSVLSLTFWYISLIGSVMLLAYGAKRRDLVYILAYLFNSIPYVRNIMLIRRANATG